jgi:hypothetical protein
VKDWLAGLVLADRAVREGALHCALSVRSAVFADLGMHDFYSPSWLRRLLYPAQYGRGTHKEAGRRVLNQQAESGAPGGERRAPWRARLVGDAAVE